MEQNGTLLGILLVNVSFVSSLQGVYGTVVGVDFGIPIGADFGFGAFLLRPGGSRGPRIAILGLCGELVRVRRCDCSLGAGGAVGAEFLQKMNTTKIVVTGVRSGAYGEVIVDSIME
jgi:hypothetical protein